MRGSALEAVQSVLEGALEEEVTAYLGFARYRRTGTGAKSPRAQRSGYFHRQLITDHGQIAQLRVPKLRAGNKARPWQILTRYQRCLQSVVDRLLFLYVAGLSLRDLQEALYVLFGALLSLSAINQVTLQMQEILQARESAPLVGTPPYLVVDGVWVKIHYPSEALWTDRAGHQRRRQMLHEQVLLVALAIWPDGRSQVIHYQLAQGEDEEAWLDFWQRLIARGLEPAQVKIIISDGTKGLLPAMKRYLPRTALQRCTVHKVRALERYLHYNDLPTTESTSQQPLSESQARTLRRSEICRAAHHIFQAPSRSEAEQRLAEFATHWQPLEPAAVANFTRGIKRCFVFYQADPSLYARLHSTNLLERFFRDFRTKSDEFGAFPNQYACLALFELILLRVCAKLRPLDFAQTP